MNSVWKGDSSKCKKGLRKRDQERQPQWPSAQLGFETSANRQPLYTTANKPDVMLYVESKRLIKDNQTDTDYY